MHRHFDWTAPGALLVAGVVTGVACGTDARNPVAPDVSARSGADGTAFAAGDRSGADANVCHRKGRGQDYVPIAIPSAAVESHLAHGDGLVGGPVPGSPRMTFDVACTPVLREAVITFSDLATHGAPFTSYDESGLTVVATQGDWEVSTTYGNPEPFVVFPNPANVPVVTASVTVTASGAQFTFSAVDRAEPVPEREYRYAADRAIESRGRLLPEFHRARQHRDRQVSESLSRLWKGALRSSVASGRSAVFPPTPAFT